MIPLGHLTVTSSVPVYTAYNGSFSMSAVVDPLISWPASPGLPLVLQAPDVVISGTVPIPTHAPIPVPRGSLAVGDALGLYENGIRIPAQVETVQTWDPSGQQRWMHVHFIGKYDSGVPRSYNLKKQSLPDTPPSTNLTVVEDSNGITVANGYIKIFVSKTNFTGPQQIWYDPTGVGSYGSPVGQDTLTAGPKVRDGCGNLWYPRYGQPDFWQNGSVGTGSGFTTQVPHTVTLEQSGPVKVTILAKGVYSPRTSFNAKGTELPCTPFAYTSRISLYAGIPWIEFQQGDTLNGIVDRVYNGTTYNDPSEYSGGYQHKIANLSYTIPISGATAFQFGADDGATTISGSISTATKSLVDDCIGYWGMGDIKDSVYENDLDGIPGVVAGKHGNAIHILGNGAFAPRPMPGVAPLATSNGGHLRLCGPMSWSIACWINLDSLSYGWIAGMYNTSPGVFESTGHFNQAFFVVFDGTNFVFYINTSRTAPQVLYSVTIGAAELGAAITSGTWYFVAARYNYDTGEMALFINTTKRTATVVGYPESVEFITFMWGTEMMGGEYHYGLVGKLDSAAIWKERALSDADVSALYNSGAGLEYPFGVTLSPSRYANPNSAYLHQLRHNKLRLLGSAAASDTGLINTSDGWLTATYPFGKAHLLVKYLKERFPKELEVSSNGIVFHVWPQHGTDNAYSMAELCEHDNLYNFWHVHKGKYFEGSLPVEIVMMMSVGPGYICTFDNTTNLITTVEFIHQWSDGQAVWFQRGNNAAVLPASTPQIGTNTYLYSSYNFSQAYYYNSSDTISAVSSGASSRVRITLSANSQYWGDGTLLLISGITGTNAGNLNGHIFEGRRIDSTHVDLIGTTWDAGLGVSSAVAKTQPYYVKVNNANSFWVYKDSALTQQVDFTTNGSGTLMVGTAAYNGEANNFPEDWLAYVNAPTGVTFLNEFALVLDPVGLDANKYQQLYEQHPIALPSTDWCADSQCFGPIAGKRNDFAALETQFDQAYLAYHEPDRIVCLGQFNWVDSNHVWKADEHRPAMGRVPMNSHYFGVESGWMMFFHSHSSDILKMVRNLTDHYSAVDTQRGWGYDSIHLSAGGHYFLNMTHCKGVTHWGDGGIACWGNHFGDSDCFLFGWLIDANRWYKDCFDACCDAMFNLAYPLMDLPTQMATNYPSGFEMRTYVPNVMKALIAYEHTHDARFLPSIYVTADAALSKPWDSNSTEPFWHPLWLNKFYEVTRDPTALAGLISNVQLGFGGIAPTVVAYQSSGDPELLKKLRIQYGNYDDGMCKNANTPFQHWGKFPGALGENYMWHQWPYFQKALRDAGLDVIGRDASIPYAVDVNGAYFTEDTPDYYIYKTGNANWQFNTIHFSYAADVSVVSIVLQGPVATLGGTGSTLFTIGDPPNNDHYYTPHLYGNLGRMAVALNASTDIFTSSGGFNNNGVNTWVAGQFVSFQVDGNSVLPTASGLTIQADPVHYYVRPINTTTFKLYRTPQDAWANVNPIDFLTVGSGWGLAAVGNWPYPAGKVAPFTNGYHGTFDVKGDAGNGVYRFTFYGGVPLVCPLTSYPEGQVIRAGVYTTKRAIGYLLPITGASTTITVAATNGLGGVNLELTDNNGVVIDTTTLVKGSNTSVSHVISNGGANPVPWKFAITVANAETASVTFSGTPGTNLFLYGPDPAGLVTIKNALGL